ncbi:MAG: RNA polymerase subunit sigma-24 [Caulobacterales bacterium 68-7]|nr:sigma-70 family RNA polymerase sigma factor [Caulobacterales bacterium]OJU13114.1 MAG: RNA polymerase subunit sigma-24 [Caulobacterales bacterium 68-7]
MSQSRREIVAWVGAQVLPHEADVRAWLRRKGAAPDEVDDVVQETYCRLAALPRVDHIANGRAYFFQSARNVAAERARRARVVRLDWLTEIELERIVDSEPIADRVLAGRQELRRIERLIEALPERCKEIFRLRRIQGISQKEIAQRLNVTENVVETQATRGLQLILAALATSEALSDERTREASNEKRANRRRDRRRGGALGDPL